VCPSPSVLPMIRTPDQPLVPVITRPLAHRAWATVGARGANHSQFASSSSGRWDASRRRLSRSPGSPFRLPDGGDSQSEITLTKLVNTTESFGDLLIHRTRVASRAHVDRDLRFTPLLSGGPMKSNSCGRLLRERRQERGLTITALAADLGVSKSYLSMLESGRRLPTSEYCTPSCFAESLSL